MSEEKKTVNERLKECTSKLYLERSKNLRLRRQLKKEKTFEEKLIDENIELKKELIRIKFQNDME